MRGVGDPSSGCGGLRFWGAAAVVMAFAALAAPGHAQEDVPPYRELLSPDGTRRASYEPFDGYPPAGVKTEVTFHLGAARGTAPAKKVVVPEIGRTIDGIRWIDSRFVLVAADFASSILDAETGVFAGQVYGLKFAVAPQAEQIAFRFGAIPRHFWQDGQPESQVGLWYREPATRDEVRWVTMGLYPKIYRWHHVSTRSTSLRKPVAAYSAKIYSPVRLKSPGPVASEDNPQTRPQQRLFS